MENQSLTVSYATSGAAGYVRHSAPSASTSSNVKVDTAPPRELTLAQQGPVFVSPKGVVDAASGVFVLQYRNHDTGEVKAQFPSKKVVEAYHGITVPARSSDDVKAQPSGGGDTVSTASTASPVSSNVGKSDTIA